MTEETNQNNPDMHIQDQKHVINTELIGIIKYRQSKKWLISIAVVSLFSLIWEYAILIDAFSVTIFVSFSCNSFIISCICSFSFCIL